jgi:hypothetical protein
MKTHLICTSAAAILVLSPSFAGSPKAGSTPDIVALEYNPRTHEWMSAGPKLVAPKYPPNPVLAKEKDINLHRSWRWWAMQPPRVLAMAIKIPLIPAGMVGCAYAVGVSHGSARYPDFTEAFDHFDPGPAIDADLEQRERERELRRSRKTAPRTGSKDEFAPTPVRTELQISRTTAAAARPSLVGGLVLNGRLLTVPAGLSEGPEIKRSLADAMRPQPPVSSALMKKAVSSLDAELRPTAQKPCLIDDRDLAALKRTVDFSITPFIPMTTRPATAEVASNQ